MSATTPNEARLEDAQSWLDIADEDLRIMRMALGVDPPLVRPAAYHCQQAAEKLLRALLLLAAVPFRKTHDLRLLAGLLPDEEARAAAGAVLGHLDMTAWAVAGRYPETEYEDMLPEAGEIAAAADRMAGLRRLVAEGIARG